MVTETQSVAKDERTGLRLIHESVFWAEDDPRHYLLGHDIENGIVPQSESQEIELDKDSFIFVYTGTRGSGKTLSMTGFAIWAVWYYGMRLVSNYPIDFILIHANGSKTEHHAELLDMYKLLCFDKDYKHCLILIDEAPDIISHMASQTWKNRLLAMFVRQLRKNRNSLILGAQDFFLIDKSMRWQTDVLVECQDAYRLYGKAQGLERGTCILLDMKDNSGQWTGQANEWETVLSMRMNGRFAWDAFDTLYEQDVWESLRKVDMKLKTYQVGDNAVQDTGYLSRAQDAIEDILQSESQLCYQAPFYRDLKLSNREKRDLSLRLSRAGVTVQMDNSRAKRFMLFTNFNRREFMGEE